MRIVFLGSGAFALPTLRWLAQSEHEVALVVTQPARPSGRGRRTTPTPVRHLADELGLQSAEALDVNTADMMARLHHLNARLGVVIAFGQKLGPKLLAMPPAGFINLHASLLPKYRGAAPINRAIMGGEQRTGCTVFKVVERMDAGPILGTRWTEIKPDEPAGELHDRLAAIGVDAVNAAIQLFEGDEVPVGTPQNEDEATRAPKLSKADGFLSFDRPASFVANQIRGVTPWPGAAARFQGRDGRWERIIVTRARRAEDPSDGTAALRSAVAPGTIDQRRYVAAADGFIEILEIKPSSGRIMTWADYVNGRHVAAGDSIVPPE